MAKTKFKKAQTVVTADFLNSLYGGLEGSAEASSLSADNPLVIGHVHDGVTGEDGHASKIDLVGHVTNQLGNINLADEAVTKRNVYSSVDPNDENLIPYYEIDSSGVKNYYLRLGEFNLQTITDNGFQTSNHIVLGRNDETGAVTYNSLLSINNDLSMDSDGLLTKSKDSMLSLSLAGEDLFSWTTKGPNSVDNPSDYDVGVINGSETGYANPGYKFGLEQRLEHDDFGYVSFVGNNSSSFNLRVVGVGDALLNPSLPYYYGETLDFPQVRSFNSNSAITFWNELYDESSDTHGSQEVMAGISVVKGEDASENMVSDLIFSVKADPEHVSPSGYSTSSNSKSQYNDESDWPLSDVMRVSRYGNVEIKRGNSFSKDYESMLHIKETFGFRENSTVFPESLGLAYNENRGVASIKLEPIIAETQSEGNNSGESDQNTLPLVVLPRELIKHHSYIDVVSISDQRRAVGVETKFKSAEESTVRESHLFKFDRYFLDKNGDENTHRALTDNTRTLGAGNAVYARNVIPSVNPFDDQSFAPTMIKVGISDGGTTKSFYVPACYESGVSGELLTDQVVVSSSNLLSKAVISRTSDLNTGTTSEYYVNGTDANNSESTGYFYPLYTSRPAFDFSVYRFQEFPGIIFYMPNSDINVARNAAPSSADYPNIEPYSGNSGTSDYYV